MKINQDFLQSVSVFGLLLLDMYRILVGSLFSIFVPQACTDHSQIQINSTALIPHSCSFEENTSDLSPLNQLVLIINAISAAFMAYGFIIEFRRERYMITHFEVDPSLPDNNLATEIEAYGGIKKSLIAKNKHYKQVFYTIGVLNIANFILSGILISEYYLDFKTATTFATSVLLIVMRLNKSIQISRICAKEMKAQSVYLLEPTTFNTIDPDYKIVAEKVPEKNVESSADASI